MNDGEKWYTAIDIPEHASKPLKNCKKRRIKLTVNNLQDLEIENEKGFVRKIRESCKISMAGLQPELTQEEIARILNMSPSGIKKIVSKHRKKEIFYECNYYDIGP